MIVAHHGSGVDRSTRHWRHLFIRDLAIQGVKKNYILIILFLFCFLFMLINEEKKNASKILAVPG